MGSGWSASVPAGPAYLPRIFEPAEYMMLWDVEQLPLRLPRLQAHGGCWLTSRQGSPCRKLGLKI